MYYQISQNNVNSETSYVAIRKLQTGPNTLRICEILAHIIYLQHNCNKDTNTGIWLHILFYFISFSHLIEEDSHLADVSATGYSTNTIDQEVMGGQIISSRYWDQPLPCPIAAYFTGTMQGIRYPRLNGYG